MHDIHRIASRASRAGLLALAMALPVAPSLHAAPVASANAWSLQATINVAGAPILDIGAQNQIGFSNEAAPFDNSVSALGFDSGANALARITTGAINTAVQWVPGASFQAVGAAADVANPNVSAVAVLNGPPLLSLTADEIRATALITGTCPPPPTPQPLDLTSDIHDYIYHNGFDLQGLSSGGDSANPALTVSGSLLGSTVLSPGANPAPNTTIGVPGVLTLILNERTTTGNGVDSLGVSVNGLHLNVNVVGVLVADVIISHADAAIDCTP